jgi:hypothetical protein
MSPGPDLSRQPARVASPDGAAGTLSGTPEARPLAHLAARQPAGASAADRWRSSIATDALIVAKRYLPPVG